MFFISEALAQEIPIEVGSALGPQPQGDPLLFNIFLISGLFILFYFLMIRPQSKRLKEQKTMLDGLVKGDEVTTSGGIIGKISKLIDDQEVEIEISKGVNVRVLRYTIQQKRDTAKANDNKKVKELKNEAPSKKEPTKKKASTKKKA